MLTASLATLPVQGWPLHHYAYFAHLTTAVAIVVFIIGLLVLDTDNRGLVANLERIS